MVNNYAVHVIFQDITHDSSSYTFSAINNKLISDKRSNFTLVFLKAACHANLSAERNFVGSSSYISI